MRFKLVSSLFCSLLLEPHEMNTRRHSFHEVFFYPPAADMRHPRQSVIPQYTHPHIRTPRRTPDKRPDRKAQAGKGRKNPARSRSRHRHPTKVQAELTSLQADKYTFRIRIMQAVRPVSTDDTRTRHPASPCGHRHAAYHTRPGTHAP